MRSSLWMASAVIVGACASPSTTTSSSTTPPAPIAPIASVSSGESADASTSRATSSEKPTEMAPEPEPPAPPDPIPGEVMGSPLTNSPTTSSDHVADADAVVLNVRPKLKRCYDTVRGKGPHVAGMVSCGLRITKQGKVAAVSVTRRDRLSNALVECIVKELKTAQFAAREDEQVIQVPVRFGVPGED